MRNFRRLPGLVVLWSGLFLGEGCHPATGPTPVGEEDPVDAAAGGSPAINLPGDAAGGKSSPREADVGSASPDGSAVMMQPTSPGDTSADTRAPGSDGGGSDMVAVVPVPSDRPASADWKAPPGLVLWFDAARGITMVGGKVSRWADQSGLKNDAMQAAAGSQPTFMDKAINDLPALVFQKAAKQFFKINDSASLNWGTGDFTLVAVTANSNPLVKGHLQSPGVLYAKHAAPPVSDDEFTFNFNWATNETMDNTNIHIMFSHDRGIGIDSKTMGWNDGKWRLYEVTRAGGNGTLKINGAMAGKAGVGVNVNSPGQSAYLGNSAFGGPLEGQVAELIAIQGTYSDAALAVLENYLMKKYALQP